VRSASRDDERLVTSTLVSSGARHSTFIHLMPVSGPGVHIASKRATLTLPVH
jgi:hypothetical protein